MKFSKKVLCALFSAAALTSPLAATKAEVAADPTLGGTVWMEYYPGDGSYNMGSGDRKFTVHFKGDNPDCVTLTDAAANGGKTLMPLKQAVQGKKITFQPSRAAAGIECLRVNDAFIMKNAKGYYLQGRLHEIRLEKQSRNFNMVSFAYDINVPKSASFRALTHAPGYVPPAPSAKKKK